MSAMQNNNTIQAPADPHMAAVNYQVLAANLAAEIISRRTFGPLRYINKDVLGRDIADEVCMFVRDHGYSIVFRYLNTINERTRTDDLKEVVKPLQRIVGEKLCILYNNFHGQDDGLFDMTATENYKAIQWDLFEFMLHFINLYAQSVAESW
jgi:hypothetical protein